MNKIKLEIEKESYRFDCPNYSGVMFVHPDEVDEVVELMSPYAKEIGVQRKRIILKGGGELKIGTVEGNYPHHNYAGCELTSVIIDRECFGKNVDCKYISVGVSSASEFIMYMVSRLRSRSEYHSHMILF